MLNPDIVNQQYKLYSSLSQTLSDVRMVQSLIPIWEEFERTEMHTDTISSDPEKPSPHDVLGVLSDKVEFENKLLELCIAEDSLPCTPVDANLENESGKHLQSLNKTSLLLSQESYTADPEALRLLDWLASSQAAEDINSDDDLKREIILSPLMPVTTINEVLEKADMEFANASQQECQDILDSVEDLTNVECINKSDCNPSPQLTSKKEIPQVDGSGDSKKPIHHSGGTSKIKDSGSSFSRKHRRKRSLWSTLPFSSSENAKDVKPTDGEIGGSSKVIMENAEKGLSKARSTIVELQKVISFDFQKSKSTLKSQIRGGGN